MQWSIFENFLSWFYFVSFTNYSRETCLDLKAGVIKNNKLWEHFVVVVLLLEDTLIYLSVETQWDANRQEWSHCCIGVKEFLNKSVYDIIFIIYVCVCGVVRAMCVARSEDNLWESVILASHHLGMTQVIMLGVKYPTCWTVSPIQEISYFRWV